MVCETAFFASKGFWLMLLSIMALIAFVVPASISAAVAKALYLAVTVKKKKKNQVMSGEASIMDKFSRLNIVRENVRQTQQCSWSWEGRQYKVLCLPDSLKVLMGLCFSGWDSPAAIQNLLFPIACLNLSVSNSLLCSICSFLKFTEYSILNNENEGFKKTLEDPLD